MPRLLLVDDQELVRRGLRLLLQTEPGMEVVAEAASGAEALAMLRARTVELALVDARMPGMSGIELVGRIRADHPGVLPVVLTTFDDDEVIWGSLAAGAAGLLLKDASVRELVAAIRAALRGETVIDPRVAGRYVELSRRRDRRDAETPPGGPPEHGLTEREGEVAALVATGASNTEIAASLSITEGTVKNHVTALLRKLGLRDRVALALWGASQRPART